MIGNTNAASGGKLFAAIGVTYPEGSVLTCTDGKKTFTAKTTTGRWIFAVPYAATWTVTATDGANSKSKTVEITGEGQLEIVNLAQVYIYKSGAGDDAAWEALIGGYTEAALTATKMTISGGSSAYIFSTVAVTTKTAIDLTEAKELVFDVQTDVAASTGVFAWVGVSKNKFERAPETSTISKDNSAAYTELSTTSRREVIVDVSQLSGEYYIFAASDGMNINTDVYNVWLE